jgi:hypothetical protein
MQGRRSDQDGGISGWVAERAGEWDLSGQDETTMQRQKFLWNVDSRRSAAVYVPSVRSGYAMTWR